jgi:hypothetical protein
MLNNTEYRGLFATYVGLTNELTTPASIVPIYTNDDTLCGVPKHELVGAHGDTIEYMAY